MLNVEGQENNNNTIISVSSRKANDNKAIDARLRHEANRSVTTPSLNRFRKDRRTSYIRGHWK
jgi:hypothetical protein